MNNEEVNRNGDKGNITSLYSTRLTTRRILHNWKTMLKKKKKRQHRRNTKLVVSLKQAEHFSNRNVRN